MDSLKKYFTQKFWSWLEKEVNNTTEIRLRVCQPVIVKGLFGERIYEECRLLPEDLDQLFERITNYSAYAYEKELKEGYLTLPGGHRVGLAGEAVYINGKFQGMKHIRFMNFRLCHSIEQYGSGLIRQIADGDRIKNTLIISRPGMGKTTMLRNLIREISHNCLGTSISVIDERNEISGAYLGVPQINLGERADILSNISKREGILMAIRALGPTIIAVDEIGEEKEKEALQYALNSGVRLLATIHGEYLEQVENRLGSRLYQQFDYFVLIERWDKYQCIARQSESS